MNCHDAEQLLLAGRDQALTPGQRADLAGHLASCTGCRRLQAGLDAAADTWRENTRNVAVPDATEEWRRLQARISDADVRRSRRRLAPVIWFAAPLAAAAAIALAFLVQSGPSSPVPAPAPLATVAAVTTAPASSADYVEVSDPNATPMVFVDQDSGWLVVWAVGTAPANG